MSAVLQRDIVPALSGLQQHHARVAANLVGIVERELRLGPATDERERAVLAGLLGDTGGVTDLLELRTTLAGDLRAGMADDPRRDETVWSALIALVRDDLAIVKPGHDSWDGD